MKHNMTITACLTTLLVASAAKADAGLLEEGFAKPPREAMPLLFNYWINGNVSSESVAKDYDEIGKIGNIGGLVTYMYGLAMYPPGPAIKYAGTAQRDAFRRAVQEADRHGLTVGLHLTPGWTPTGGPWITEKPQYAAQKLTYSEVSFSGPLHFHGKLPQPATVGGYYKDLAIVAFKAPEEFAGPSLREAGPTITANVPIDSRLVMDGNNSTQVDIPANGFLEISFEKPFAARSLFLSLNMYENRLNYRLSVADEAGGYRMLREEKIWRPQGVYSTWLSFDAAEGKRFRLDFLETENFSGKLKSYHVAEVNLSSLPRVDNSARKLGALFITPTRPLEALGSAVGSAAFPGVQAQVDLTEKVSADGEVTWDVPAGKYTILRIGATLTGSTTHHFAVPDEKEAGSSPAERGSGLSSDPMSREATEFDFEHSMGPFIQDAGAKIGKIFATVWADSWESKSPNWTPLFRAKFLELRGYDLAPYWPVLGGYVVGDADRTTRFCYDFRRTLADLRRDNYFKYSAELAHRHGLKFGSQSYPIIASSLECLGAADVPQGEFWTSEWPVDPYENEYDFKYTALAVASAAHTYGRPIASMESFTNFPGRNNGANFMRQHPFALKALGDFMFVCGINQFSINTTYNSFAPSRSAEERMAPGFSWDALQSINPKTPWWNNGGRAWFAYLARCEYLLQTGRFVADVCRLEDDSHQDLGLPDFDVKHKTTAAREGYDYDWLSRELLLSQTKVENGEVVLTSGMRYRVLAVNSEGGWMTPEVAAKLRDLVRDGATVVVSERPVKSPSLRNYPQCDAELRKTVADLWGDLDGQAHTVRAYGQGRIVWMKDPFAALAVMGLRPDFEYQAAEDGAQLNFIHRVTDEADIYFVANARETQAVRARCTFRVKDRSPELWRPDTGAIERCPMYRRTADGRIEIPMQFDPAGSVFVVFRRPLSDRVAELRRDGQVIDWKDDKPGASLGMDDHGRLQVLARTGGRYEAVTVGGKIQKVEIGSVPEPLAIAGPWQVNFQEHLGAPAAATFDQLASWTENANDGIKYFSGTATYTKEVEIPAGLVGNNVELELDLGRVGIVAEVTLNGQNLGVCWKPPFRVALGSAVKVGKNQLVIRVTNCWINRLIGDERFPLDADYKHTGAGGGFSDGYSLVRWPAWLVNGQPRPEPCRVTFTNQIVWKKDDPLMESGLIGPVTIYATIRRELK